MKKVFISLAMLALISCKKDLPDIGAISDPQSNLNGIENEQTLSSTIPFKEKGWVELNDIVFNPCTNEELFLTGTITFMVNLTLIGDRIRYGFRFHYSGVKGLGLTSGKKYTVTGHATNNFMVQDNGTSFSDVLHNTVTDRVIFACSGNGNNFVSDFKYHITKNSAMEIKVERIENYSFHCQ